MKYQKSYIAFVLDEASVGILKKEIPPLYKKIFYHHMTMAFKPSEHIYDKYKEYIGKTFELNVSGYCFDEKCQAVFVDTHLSENDFPHITLSCDENTNPVYSNILMKNKTNYQPFSLKISGKVQIIYT